ncbi:MAG: hypothetical protein JRJ58_24465 [Deltaproteobacteria bacterium]|nr:hypothetical protein [Deltaproteobacteria bacterium]
MAVLVRVVCANCLRKLLDVPCNRAVVARNPPTLLSGVDELVTHPFQVGGIGRAKGLDIRLRIAFVGPWSFALELDLQIAVIVPGPGGGHDQQKRDGRCQSASGSKSIRHGKSSRIPRPDWAHPDAVIGRPGG